MQHKTKKQTKNYKRIQNQKAAQQARQQLSEDQLLPQQSTFLQNGSMAFLVAALLAGKAANGLHELHTAAWTNVQTGVQTRLSGGIKLGRKQAAAACFIPAMMVPALALQPGVRVTVDGQPVGYVSDGAAVESAIQKLEADASALTGSTVELGADVKTGFALVHQSQMMDEGETAQAIADADNELASASVVLVDGEPVGITATDGEARLALDLVKEQYGRIEAENLDFAENVEVSTGIVPTSQIEGADALYRTLTTENDGQQMLSVTGHFTESHLTDIPYDTITRENDQLASGKTQVVQEGQNGQMLVIENVSVLNGVEQSRETVSQTVMTEATPQIVEVGTKNTGIGTGTLRVPLNSWRFSSGFGYRSDGFHGGVDLLTPTGSSVYAADNGKVIVSEYHPSWGYYIKIDHGNGMKTLYAHNSKLIAQVGDVVAKGDLIALSGSTGSSTAPHCHFEVYIDDNRVNPTKYVNV